MFARRIRCAAGVALAVSLGCTAGCSDEQDAVVTAPREPTSVPSTVVTTSSVTTSLTDPTIDPVTTRSTATASTQRELEIDIPPIDGFVGIAEAVPPAVLARSSWRDDCPVGAADLAYVTITHWGFDGTTQPGELLVNREAADDLVRVFKRLYELRFPIEELRILTLEEVGSADTTGTGNVSSAFECRPSTGSARWSRHAYGLAIDINPFVNPYKKGEVIIPSRSQRYVDRSDPAQGMLFRGDGAVEAFESIGWEWGGEWRSAKDWMHFSDNGQ